MTVRTIMPMMPIIMVVAMGLILISSILMAIWVYKDAKAHGENGLLWLVIVIVVPNALGLVLYLLLVKREEKKICPTCGSYNPLNASHCGQCGGSLDQAQRVEAPGNKLWIVALVFLALAIVLIVGSLAFMAQQDGAYGLVSQINSLV